MNIKLLKNLDFASKINGTEAVTEAGKELLQNYRGYIYSNPVTCGIVNGFIREAAKFSFDTGLVGILESVNSFIKENSISWQLASACESINANNSSYGYLAKMGLDQVDKLLEMNESEVVSYLKAGAMKNLTFIPEFRQILKNVYASTIQEVHAPNYVVSTPVSYVVVSESEDTKDTYFMVLGKTYKRDKDNNVCEAVCDDPKFVRVNALLNSFSKDDNSIFVEYKGTHGDTARFTINENGLEFTKGDTKETFANAADFRQYCDTVSKPMSMNEKLHWMKATSAIAEVFECNDNITALDNVNVLQTSTGSICTIVEGANVVLSVNRSINAGTSTKSYDFMVEALNDLIKVSGIDLKGMYESRIDEDCKKADPEKYAEIKEQLEADKEAAFAARRKKIAMLAEQFKNDPVKITLLNKAAKELAMLEK
ncbi:MAG: hypothetical protein IJH39_12635 [Clostridia bacterium]|nr:hypothetical protein [Clostridia bacterium]